MSRSILVLGRPLLIVTIIKLLASYCEVQCPHQDSNLTKLPSGDFRGLRRAH